MRQKIKGQYCTFGSDFNVIFIKEDSDSWCAGGSGPEGGGGEEDLWTTWGKIINEWDTQGNRKLPQIKVRLSITLQGKYIYVFLFWELHGLSHNFCIHVSVSDLYILRIGPQISLEQNRQTNPGNI